MTPNQFGSYLDHAVMGVIALAGVVGVFAVAFGDGEAGRYLITLALTGGGVKGASAAATAAKRRPGR